MHLTPGLITEDGTVTNEGTEQFRRNYMNQYATFVTRVLSVVPQGT